MASEHIFIIRDPVKAMLTALSLGTTYAAVPAWTGAGSHWRNIQTIRNTSGTPAGVGHLSSAAGGLACQTASVGRGRRDAGICRIVRQVGGDVSYGL